MAEFLVAPGMFLATSFGAVSGGSRFDASTDVPALKLLDSALVAAYRVHVGSQLLSSRCIAEFVLYSAQQPLHFGIYGVCQAAAQLATALLLAVNHRIVTFLDDNPAYRRRSINVGAT